MTDSATVVVMPTYNEADTLADTWRDLRDHLPNVTLLVVDDGSPDGTGTIADALAVGDEHMSVLHRPAKAGLGAAYLAGFRWALDHGAGYVVEIGRAHV